MSLSLDDARLRLPLSLSLSFCSSGPLTKGKFLLSLLLLARFVLCVCVSLYRGTRESMDKKSDAQARRRCVKSIQTRTRALAELSRCPFCSFCSLVCAPALNSLVCLCECDTSLCGARSHLLLAFLFVLAAAALKLVLSRYLRSALVDLSHPNLSPIELTLTQLNTFS